MKRLFLLGIASLGIIFAPVAFAIPDAVTPPDTIRRIPDRVKPPVLEKIEFVHYPRIRRPRPTPTPAPSVSPQPSVSSSPSPTPAASCPNPDVCNSYSLSSVKWVDPNGADDTGLPYFLNFANPSGILEQVLQEKLATSFNVWESAQTKKTLKYRYSGTTTKNAGVQDFVNTVSFVDISRSRPGALAVTTVWYRPDTRALIEFDIAFNSVTPWRVNSWPAGCTEYPVNSCVGDTSGYDFENVAVHEIGHTLMLLDLTQTLSREMTMYGYAQTGELKKRTLGRGDITGVNTLYP